MQDGGVEGCEGGLSCGEVGEEGGGRVGDVVLFFAQLRACLGEREGAEWVHKRRGARRVIRREG